MMRRAGPVAAALGIGAVSVGLGHRMGGPLLGRFAAVAMLIQWVAFVPAYAAQTERFYDLTGTLTYLTLVGMALSQGTHPRALILAALVSVWALRLGSFLVRRIHDAGGDGRFDAIKPSRGRFLMAWSLQGLWVFLTACAALVLMLGPATPLGPVDALGYAIWTLGFGLEVVADRQKDAFRRREAKAPPWIDEGLWSWSRHPNYLGEILLWTGIAVSGLATYEGAMWLALLSPVFVTVLLTRISGIPLLERRADDRWGDRPGYQAYKLRVGVLLPRWRQAPDQRVRR